MGASIPDRRASSRDRQSGTTRATGRVLRLERQAECYNSSDRQSATTRATGRVPRFEQLSYIGKCFAFAIKGKLLTILPTAEDDTCLCKILTRAHKRRRGGDKGGLQPPYLGRNQPN